MAEGGTRRVGTGLNGRIGRLAMLVLWAGLLAAVGTGCQRAELVHDTNQDPVGSRPNRLMTLGDRVYFVANDFQLWSTDGTEPGTVAISTDQAFIADLLLSAVPFESHFAHVNGRTLFPARGDSNGIELWGTDGTPSGTSLVKDLVPGGVGSRPVNLIEAGGRVFFSAFANSSVPGEIRPTLWVTDGTPSGTTTVKDLGMDNNARQTTEMRELGGRLYFLANGDELWVTDGTPGGTSWVAGSVASIETHRGRLYFGTSGPQPGELWVIDGTASAPTKLADVDFGWPQPTLTNEGPTDGRFYFVADDGVHGPELWVTDATPAGTEMVVDLVPGPTGPRLLQLTGSGDRVYFEVRENSQSTLWVTDGTEAGTRRLTEPNDYGPSNPLDLNGTLLFHLTSDQDRSRSDLWASQGTQETTIRLTDFADRQPTETRVSLLAVSGDQAFFFATDVGNNVRELWVTDGTRPGTRLVQSFNAGASAGGTTELDGKLYFGAVSPDAGAELHVLDLQTLAISLVKDANPGTMDGSAQRLVVAGDKLFFEANGGRSGGLAVWASDGTTATRAATVDQYLYEFVPFGDRLVFVDGSNPTWSFRITDGTPGGTTTLYQGRVRPVDAPYLHERVEAGQRLFLTDGSAFRMMVTDGTRGGTRRLDAADPSNQYSYPRSLTAVGSQLFFVANSGGLGGELWVSDGQASGTRMVKDIWPGWASLPDLLTATTDRLFFVADDGQHGAELWVSDGTEAGTSMVIDLNPGPSSSRPFHLTPFGDGLAFVADRSVWMTDGTEIGTIRLAGQLDDPVPLGSTDGALYFTTTNGNRERELWVTDGTAGGATMVTSLGAGVAISPEGADVANGRIFFSVQGPGRRTLWTSDGTAAGTTDLAPLPPFGDPNAGLDDLVVAVDDTVYFLTGLFGGTALWSTDGTPANTRPVRSFDDAISLPALGELTEFQGALFFSADDGVHGREIWKASSLLN